MLAGITNINTAPVHQSNSYRILPVFAPSPGHPLCVALLGSLNVLMDLLVFVVVKGPDEFIPPDVNEWNQESSPL